MKMYEPRNEAPPIVWTIGHSNHPIGRFLALLDQNRVEALVDIRSRPYSRWCPQFNLKAIRQAVEQAGLEYHFLGRELGGMPEEASFYDDEGYVLYDRLAQSQRFQEGLGELMAIIDHRRAAILCAEKNPEGCHRRVLVGRVLLSKGLQLRHILGDGRTRAEGALPQSQGKSQGDLIPEGSDEAWKSVSPVLKRP